MTTVPLPSPATPPRAPRSRRRIAALLAGVVGAGGAVVGLPLAVAGPVAAAEQGTLVPGSAPSEALGAGGAVDYTVYLPPGYDEDAEQRYPTVYLLHGRGDTQAAWQRVATDLDELIGTEAIQPLVVVMPDAPWNDRGSWYTDSAYEGADGAGPGGGTGAGFQVETALTRDLVGHVDATYRTVADREARAVGGYSMGGAGALRLTLAHQDEFSAGIVLSPAVYVPSPPRTPPPVTTGATASGTSCSRPSGTPSSRTRRRSPRSIRPCPFTCSSRSATTSGPTRIPPRPATTSTSSRPSSTTPRAACRE